MKETARRRGGRAAPRCQAVGVREMAPEKLVKEEGIQRGGGLEPGTDHPGRVKEEGGRHGQQGLRSRAGAKREHGEGMEGVETRHRGSNKGEGRGGGDKGGRAGDEGRLRSGSGSGKESSEGIKCGREGGGSRHQEGGSAGTAKDKAGAVNVEGPIVDRQAMEEERLGDKEAPQGREAKAATEDNCERGMRGGEGKGRAETKQLRPGDRLGTRNAGGGEGARGRDDGKGSARAEGSNGQGTRGREDEGGKRWRGGYVVPERGIGPTGQHTQEVGRHRVEEGGEGDGDGPGKERKEKVKVGGYGAVTC